LWFAGSHQPTELIDPGETQVNEVGLFGNQNTVCQPTTPKWRHTVERLKTYFTKGNAG